MSVDDSVMDLFKLTGRAASACRSRRRSAQWAPS